MGEILRDSAILDDKDVKIRRLYFKLHVDTSDCPEIHVITGVPTDAVLLNYEDDTGACSTTVALEDCACWDNGFTACPTDAVGQVGFLIDASVIEGASASILEVHGVSLLNGNNPLFDCGAVDEHDLIVYLGTDVDVGGAVHAGGVTPAGNIAFELTSTVNFATADYTQFFEVIYSIR